MPAFYLLFLIAYHFIMKHQLDNTVFRGLPPGEARRAMIMIHGRGADAADILSLTGELGLTGFTFAAPQASGFSWYPYSFMAPVENNEPWLSSALALLDKVVEKLLDEGLAAEDIYLLGFSQGACLSVEFAARSGRPFGGVFVLSGGLIGASLNEANYQARLDGLPVFLGCSDVDPHIPLQRVRDTERILRERGAEVSTKIYPGMAHTINMDEIDHVKAMIH